MWCNIVGAGHIAELLACVDVAFWESYVSHDLEEYYVIHAPEGSFEIGIGHVYVFFDILASSYIIMCVDMMSYIFPCRLNPSDVSLSIPCASAQGEPNVAFVITFLFFVFEFLG